MSTITEQLTRLQGSKETLSAKGVELGISLGTDKLDEIVNKFDQALEKKEITEQVKEGETFTIPQGYHDGSGTVSGVAGGGSYELESATVTPTKATQQITSGDGYFGLSDVTVNPIPDEYQDVTTVTATASDVLTGSFFVNSIGESVQGTMVSNSATQAILDSENLSSTIAQGYHDGTGTVSITLEDATITPSTSEQVATATSGKVLGTITVEAIPSEFVDMSAVEVDLEKVLAGTEVVTKDGTAQGTMTDNGKIEASFDGLTSSSYTIPKGYHNGEGQVSLSDDIYNALVLI